MKISAFQNIVSNWSIKCFGITLVLNKRQRNQRFLEEALKLVQACDCSEKEAIMLVKYVYSRPKGTKPKKAAGVLAALSVLCFVNKIDLEKVSLKELVRISTKECISKIRLKQVSKPNL